MKKSPLIGIALLLLSTPLFATDLSQFEGTWVYPSNGTKIVITQMDDEMLVIKNFANFDIKTTGETSLPTNVEGLVLPINFSYGMIDESRLIISATLKYSAITETYPDMTSTCSVTLGNQGTAIEIVFYFTSYDEKEGLTVQKMRGVFQKETKSDGSETPTPGKKSF